MVVTWLIVGAMVDALPEATQKAVEEAVASYPAAWRSCVCAFSLIKRATGDNIDRYGEKNGAVCHAGVGRLTEPTIVVNAHKRRWADKSQDFLLWVARESPFSHGILNRDNDKEILGKASVIDTELVGKGGALWLCKALRHFEEDVWKLDTWTKLREGGLNGLQAFIGSDILSKEGKPAGGNTHVSLYCYSSPKELRKFYDEVLKMGKNTTNNANRGGYDYGANKEINWGSLAGKKERKPDGWGGFTEIDMPCPPEEYIAKLKEIFEGDPKNVR